MTRPKIASVIALLTSLYGLNACHQEKDSSKTGNDALVLTINNVGDEAKKYTLSYRLYCDSTDEKVSEKLNSATPTETISDSANITGSSISFTSEEVKKLSDGAKCLLDIYSSDSSAQDKFKWTLEDTKGTPVKGVFYVSTPGTISNKSVSLTLYATFVDLSDTYPVGFKTTYPKELAGKTVSSSYLSCGSNKQNVKESGGNIQIDAKDFTATHRFDVKKSDFKDNDVNCAMKADVEGKEYQSKSAIKIAKNPEGKPIDLATEMSLSPPGRTSDTISVNVSFKSSLCEIKTGTNGCVPK